MPTTIVSSKTRCICKPLLSKEPSISMSKGSSHQDLSALSKITARRRINGYQLELSPESPTVHNVFPHNTTSGVFPTSLLARPLQGHRPPSHRPLAQSNLPRATHQQPGSKRTSYTKPHHQALQVQWSTTRKQKQHEDLKTTPDPSLCIPFCTQSANLGDEILVRGVGLSHLDF